MLVWPAGNSPPAVYRHQVTPVFPRPHPQTQTPRSTSSHVVPHVPLPQTLHPAKPRQLSGCAEPAPLKFSLAAEPSSRKNELRGSARRRGERLSRLGGRARRCTRTVGEPRFSACEKRPQRNPDTTGARHEEHHVQRERRGERAAARRPPPSPHGAGLWGPGARLPMTHAGTPAEAHSPEPGLTSGRFFPKGRVTPDGKPVFPTAARSRPTETGAGRRAALARVRAKPYQKAPGSRDLWDRLLENKFAWRSGPASREDPGAR